MIFTGRKNATLRSRSRPLRVTRMEQERTEETEKVRNHSVLAPGRINEENKACIEMSFMQRKRGNKQDFSVLSVPACEIKPAK